MLYGLQRIHLHRILSNIPGNLPEQANWEFLSINELKVERLSNFPRVTWLEFETKLGPGLLTPSLFVHKHGSSLLLWVLSAQSSAKPTI